MNTQEKVALVLNHAAPEEFERLRNVLQTATDDQLDVLVRSAQAVAAKNAAELEMQTAKAKLLLSQNGLMQSEQNFLILQAHLGDYYTFDQARTLIESNATVKQGLIWRGIPFGQYNQAVAEQQAVEAREQAKDRERHQKQRAIFNAAVRELLRHGINVASTDANYNLVEEYLQLNAEFNVQNVVDAIKNAGLAFSPNDPQQVQQFDSQDRQTLYNSIKHRLMDDEASRKVRELVKTGSIVDLRKRIEAVTVLGEDYSRDPHAKDQSFRSWLASIYSTKDLQDRAEGVLHNRKLRSMTPAELRAQAAAARQPIQQHEYPKLPPELYDGTRIVAADANAIRGWIKKFGQPQLNEAIARYKKLNAAWQQEN